jgi:SP family general alpha glucoside:H+ symporter-like MFS transporter
MEPHMVNAFFWGTLSLLTTIWAYFRLPETKDRTFVELDILFIRGVKSRHFAEVNMDSDEDYTNTD